MYVCCVHEHMCLGMHGCAYTCVHVRDLHVLCVHVCVWFLGRHLIIGISARGNTQKAWKTFEKRVRGGVWTQINFLWKAWALVQPDHIAQPRLGTVVYIRVIKLFCKGLDKTYFHLCGSHDLCCDHWTLMWNQKAVMNEWTWLTSNKLYLRTLTFEFHVLFFMKYNSALKYVLVIQKAKIILSSQVEVDLVWVL